MNGLGDPNGCINIKEKPWVWLYLCDKWVPDYSKSHDSVNLPFSCSGSGFPPRTSQFRELFPTPTTGVEKPSKRAKVSPIKPIDIKIADATQLLLACWANLYPGENSRKYPITKQDWEVLSHNFMLASDFQEDPSREALVYTFIEHCTVAAWNTYRKALNKSKDVVSKLLTEIENCGLNKKASSTSFTPSRTTNMAYNIAADGSSHVEQLVAYIEFMVQMGFFDKQTLLAIMLDNYKQAMLYMEVKDCGKLGLGIFAKTVIKTGTILGQYLGIPAFIGDPVNQTRTVETNGGDSIFDGDGMNGNREAHDGANEVFIDTAPGTFAPTWKWTWMSYINSDNSNNVALLHGGKVKVCHTIKKGQQLFLNYPGVVAQKKVTDYSPLDVYH